jgi:uncharacterized protein (DUF305 family)
VRRSRVAVAGVIVAACAAVAGIALAVSAVVSSGTSTAAPSSSRSASAEPVTADDFCYVEAMIYYRVEAVDLADAVLEKTGISAATHSFAEDLVKDQTTQLEKLRPWYVSWTSARPLERPQEGPCAGHGSTHAQMPGLPTPSQWDQLLAADGADAERLYLQLLIAQNTAMIDFAGLVLDGQPHSRVQQSAEQVIAQGTEDVATLEGLLADLP